VTDPAEGVRSQRAHVAWVLRGLSLPCHVIVLVGTRWRRGWLIAREHGPDGWTGLVQYDDAGAEVTEYLPAERIAPPELWLADRAGQPRALPQPQPPAR
jgi:hypothetical protein